MRTIILRYDKYVAKLVSKFPRSWEPFFKLLGLIIRPGFWIAVALLFALLANTHNESGTMFLCFALLLPLSGIIKFYFKRARPVTIYSKNMKIKSYSFPSSHAYAAATGACMLAYGASVVHLSVPLVALFGAALALIVAVSRVHVGAHYPSDVTAGLLLGGIVSILLLEGTNYV